MMHLRAGWCSFTFSVLFHPLFWCAPIFALHGCIPRKLDWLSLNVTDWACTQLWFHPLLFSLWTLTTYDIWHLQTHLSRRNLFWDSYRWIHELSSKMACLQCDAGLKVCPCATCQSRFHPYYCRLQRQWWTSSPPAATPNPQSQIFLLSDTCTWTILRN